jgi:tetratricopeptide (TPR) repeat protein
VSQTTLSRWENGHQQPYRRYRKQLCRVLGKDPVDLGFEEELLEVDRRELVQRLIGALGTLAVKPLVGGAGLESLERLASAAGRPSRVDVTTVEHLELVTQIHRSLYHDLSSAELMPAVIGHLQVTVLLLGGAQRLPLRRRLARIAGETAGHGAWLCHDLGDKHSAARYYDVADVATEEAGEPALASYVLGFRSLVMGSEGQAHKALALARSAVELDTRFLAVAGGCYGQLGKTAAAERTLREALDALGSKRSRRRADTLIDLARVRAQQQDVDEAAGLACESLEIALETGSMAGIQRVHRFRPELARWDGTPAVIVLDEQLHDGG